MSVLKKENDRVQSKYIKNHYIPSEKKTKTVMIEQAEESKKQEDRPGLKTQSKYIKRTGMDIGKFEFNISNPLVCIAFASLIFGVYLVAGSGFGASLRLGDLNYFLAFLLPIVLYLSRKRVYFPQELKPVYMALLVFSCVIFISYTKALEYELMLKMLLIVTPPLTMSYLGYSPKSIKYTSYAYIGLSLFFVLDYAAGGITAGWNPNTIGVYTLFGVVWLVFLGAEREKRNIILEVIVFAVAATQMVVTNCRSVLVALVIFAIFMYLVPKSLMKKKLFFRPLYIVALLFPFIVVIFLVSLSQSPLAAELDAWSLEHTEKFFFSGREKIWKQIFDIVSEPIFGNGSNFAYYMPHNLFALLFLQIGYLGYFLMCTYFACIFEFLHKYFDDHIVRGSFIAFITVYISQSFESTMVEPQMLCVPAYLTLAVGVGRACMINKKQKEKQVSGANDEIQRDNSDI